MTADLKPWVTAFGEDTESWNLHLDSGEEDGEGSGLPGLSVVAGTFQTYRDCTGRGDPAELAAVFNLPIALATAAHGAMRPAGAAGALGDDIPRSDLQQMLMDWCCLRGDEPSVALAATTFGVHPTLIIEAVGSGYWLYLSGDRNDLNNLTIGVDGE